MSRRDDMNAKAARVEAKYGKTLGASKGAAPAQKPKTSLKGTNPLKKKAAITRTWKF